MKVEGLKELQMFAPEYLTLIEGIAKQFEGVDFGSVEVDIKFMNGRTIRFSKGALDSPEVLEKEMNIKLIGNPSEMVITEIGRKN